MVGDVIDLETQTVMWVVLTAAAAFYNDQEQRMGRVGRVRAGCGVQMFSDEEVQQ